MHTISKNEEKAIGEIKTSGPSFGGGEWNDLILSDKKYPKDPNWRELGATYSLPEGISFKSTEARSYLAGPYEFGMEEYEVFGVKMKLGLLCLEWKKKMKN